MKSIIICLVFLSTCLSMPEPKHPEGYTFGGNKANVRVDLYYDLLCIDSKNYHIPFKQFLKTVYDKSQNLTFFD